MISLVDLDESHPLCRSSQDSDSFDLETQDHPVAGHDHDLVFITHESDADHRAVLLGDFDVDDPFSASTLKSVLLEGGPFSVPPFGDREQSSLFLRHRHADDSIPLPQLDTFHSRCRPPHGSDIGCCETNGEPVPRGEHGFVFAAGYGRGNQRIPLGDADGEDPSGHRIGKGGQGSFLHPSALRRH